MKSSSQPLTRSGENTRCGHIPGGSKKMMGLSSSSQMGPVEGQGNVRPGKEQRKVGKQEKVKKKLVVSTKVSWRCPAVTSTT